MRTDQHVIDRLVADARPVRPLPSPAARLIRWLTLSVPLVAIIVAIMSLRPDLSAKLSDGRYLLEQGAALTTALLAGFAAFSLSIPGQPRWPMLLPAISLSIWLACLGEGCAIGYGGWSLSSDWQCLPAIAITGAAPALAMVKMLRRGAPLFPRSELLLGALAAAALGNVGLRLFHPQDASLMVLVWQFGSVMLLSAACGGLGPRVLRWRH